MSLLIAEGYLTTIIISITSRSIVDNLVSWLLDMYNKTGADIGLKKGLSSDVRFPSFVCLCCFCSHPGMEKLYSGANNSSGTKK